MLDHAGYSLVNRMDSHKSPRLTPKGHEVVTRTVLEQRLVKDMDVQRLSAGAKPVTK